MSRAPEAAQVEVRIVLFAVAAERAGRRALALRVAASEAGGPLVRDVRAALAAAVPALRPLLPACALAVGDEYAREDAAVPDGATVAVIPPVSGGSDDPRASIEDKPLDPAALAAQVLEPDNGGVVVFVGTVRARTGERQTERLEYESHRPLAVREMRRILDEVAREVPGSRLAAAHRVGALGVGEAAVVVAASAPHRDGAFAAARRAIDRIKAEVPIWKREVGPDGAEWVEGTEVGPSARG